MELKEKFRHVYDFPKKGIDFIDITTVLGNGGDFREAIDKVAELTEKLDCDVVIGSEARGFIIGAPVAYKLGIGFVPVRKKGKLPYKTITGSYDLEYGTDVLQMHEDAVKEGQRVVIVDDLIATGGTIACISDMVEELGGKVIGAVALVELSELSGREILEGKGIDVYTVVKM